MRSTKFGSAERSAFKASALQGERLKHVLEILRNEPPLATCALLKIKQLKFEHRNTCNKRDRIADQFDPVGRCPLWVPYPFSRRGLLGRRLSERAALFFRGTSQELIDLRKIPQLSLKKPLG